MAHELKRASENLLKAGCLVLVLCMSVYVMMCFMFGSDFFGIGDRSPQALMEYTAPKPHAQRQLVPAIARGIFIITPQSALKPVTDTLHELWWNSSTFSAMVHFRHPIATPPELNDNHLFIFSLFALIEYSFLLGFAWVMWLLGKQLFPNQLDIQLLGVVTSMAVLPVFCGKYGSACDFPVLFFGALLTLLIAKEKPVLYCVILALATLNKETTFYVMAVYFLYGYQHFSKQKWIFFGVLQVIVYATVRLASYLLVPNPAGSMVDQNGLSAHLQMGWDGYNMPTLLSIAAMMVLFTYRLETKPLVLRCWQWPWLARCWTPRQRCA
jgi:hypothetical protein